VLSDQEHGAPLLERGLDVLKLRCPSTDDGELGRGFDDPGELFEEGDVHLLTLPDRHDRDEDLPDRRTRVPEDHRNDVAVFRNQVALEGPRVDALPQLDSRVEELANGGQYRLAKPPTRRGRKHPWDDRLRRGS
jgi:hypothetical protein